MDTLLDKVKQNLILSHAADDALLESYITAAISYAESYQHITAGSYHMTPMPPTTEFLARKRSNCDFLVANLQEKSYNNNKYAHLDDATQKRRIIQ